MYLSLAAPTQSRTLRKFSFLARVSTHFAFSKSLDSLYPCGGTRLEALQHTLCICVDIEDDGQRFVKREHSVPCLAQDLLGAGDSLAPPNIFTSMMIPHKTTLLRRLIKTKKGYLGIASRYAEPSDSVCMLFGGKVPFVLRRWS
jgi:hypothetical protein